TGEQEKNDGIHTYQLAGTVDTDFNVKKFSTPILREIEHGYNTYFRNQYVFSCDEEINMMIGTMNSDEFGRIIMYCGKSLDDLNIVGEINTVSGIFGYFWESP